MFSITENEVLHLPDGDLASRVNAVYDSNATESAVASIHTIVGGTHRYVNASGFLLLSGTGRPRIERASYVGVIRVAPPNR